MQEFVWLEYPLTGGKAQFSAQSADIWRQKGWQDCDPPIDGEEPPPSVAGVPVEATEKLTADKTTARNSGGTDTTTRPEE